MPKKITYYSVAGLNKSIRKLPKEAKASLRDANVRVASKVAKGAADRARSVGGIAKHVAPSIRAGRDTVPIVKMGSAQVLPESGAGWERKRTGPSQTIGDVIWGAEFGGGRRPSTSQFSPWRGSDDGAGYFLWPTVRGDREYIADAFEDAIADAEAASFKGERR